jgi:hypothetical protein
MVKLSKISMNGCLDRLEQVIGLLDDMEKLVTAGQQEWHGSI